MTDQGSGAIRVLVLHDAQLMGAALGALLRDERGFRVRTASWHEGVDHVRQDQPHVCVADVESDHADSLAPAGALAQGMARAGSRLVVLAGAGRPGYLRRAFAARADGYVDKDALPGRLADAVRAVCEGERFVDESLAFGFLQAADMPLTPRELSVLQLAAKGDSVADIARTLSLSTGTVRNYTAAAVRKTGARNRIDAIRIARAAGWL